MANRRSLNKRFSRYSRGSGGSNVLNPDTDILGDEYPYWWRNLGNNTITRQSTDSTNFNQTSRRLNSNSSIRTSNDLDDSWWQVLEGTPRNLKSLEKVKDPSKKDANDGASEMSESEEEVKITKKKPRLQLEAKKVDGNEFLSALKNSRVLVIPLEKDPAFQKSSFAQRFLSTSLISNDSKQPNKVSDTESSSSGSPGIVAKPRPNILQKKLRNRNANAFEGDKLAPTSKRMSLRKSLPTDKRFSIAADSPVIAAAASPRKAQKSLTDSDHDLSNCPLPKATSTLLGSSTLSQQNSVVNSNSDTEPVVMKPKSKLLRRHDRDTKKNLFENILMEDKINEEKAANQPLPNASAVVDESAEEPEPRIEVDETTEELEPRIVEDESKLGDANASKRLHPTKKTDLQDPTNDSSDSSYGFLEPAKPKSRFLRNTRRSPKENLFRRIVDDSDSSITKGTANLSQNDNSMQTMRRLSVISADSNACSEDMHLRLSNSSKASDIELMKTGNNKPSSSRNSNCQRERDRRTQIRVVSISSNEKEMMEEWSVRKETSLLFSNNSDTDNSVVRTFLEKRPRDRDKSKQHSILDKEDDVGSAVGSPSALPTGKAGYFQKPLSTSLKERSRVSRSRVVSISSNEKEMMEEWSVRKETSLLFSNNSDTDNSVVRTFLEKRPRDRDKSKQHSILDKEDDVGSAVGSPSALPTDKAGYFQKPLSTSLKERSRVSRSRSKLSRVDQPEESEEEDERTEVDRLRSVSSIAEELESRSPNRSTMQERFQTVPNTEKRSLVPPKRSGSKIEENIEAETRIELERRSTARVATEENSATPRKRDNVSIRSITELHASIGGVDRSPNRSLLRLAIDQNAERVGSPSREQSRPGPSGKTGSLRPLSLNRIEEEMENSKTEMENRPKTVHGRTSNLKAGSGKAKSSAAPQEGQKGQRNMKDFFKTNVTAVPASQALSNPETAQEVRKKLDEIKKREVEEEMKKIRKLTVAAEKMKSRPRPRPKQQNSVPRKVDKAYLVNGLVYKQPRLPRPMKWVTDRLYQHLWKQMEPKFKLETRVQSEKFVCRLSEVARLIAKSKTYPSYKNELNALMKEMARLQIIRNRHDFYNFCHDFLPYELRAKMVPILLPGNQRTIPYDPSKLHEPLLSP
ncbi:uncharacterized protein LOC143365766 [Halictus rubicundus]|uniref:uncharacterized protein LOC143365766 n=1 Tax=Halictus rubicundus TaxID=77578 RepID=UPI0040358C4A